MARRPSSVGLRAVSDAPALVRLRRTDLEDAFLERSSNEAARLRIPVREPLRPGEPVTLEISFGAMFDELLLTATVAAFEGELEHGSLCATVTLPLAENQRVAYLHEVLDGGRSPSARRHRRVPVDLEVRWSWNGSRYASRARDLSHGGAFIESRILPEIGAKVDVELRFPAGSTALALDAEVTWLRDRARARGFGVSFKLPDRSAAARLRDAVRECEIEFGS